eukprot:3133793-Rhodomonas_salina.2
MFGSPDKCTSLFQPSLEAIDLPPCPICFPAHCHTHWTNVSDMQPQDKTVEVMTRIVAVQTLLCIMCKDALPGLDGVHRALRL